jgi:hypothetical protein
MKYRFLLKLCIKFITNLNLLAFKKLFLLNFKSQVITKNFVLISLHYIINLFVNILSHYHFLYFYFTLY